MTRTITSTMAIGFLFSAGLLVGACGGRTPTITGPSSATADAVPTAAVPGSEIKSHSIVGHVMTMDSPARAIVGARIVITDGPDIGRVTTTDVNGGYFFSKIVAGSISLEVSHGGFQSWSSKTWFLDTDMTIDPRLASAAAAN